VGFGVRVLDASQVAGLKVAWENYKEHFAKGKQVNFHSVCSFGKDENLLQDFIDRGSMSPVIVLKCENVNGYLIEDISMMPRLGNKNEGELLVECPSYFTVINQPIKLNNFVIVQIEHNIKKSQLMAYLPLTTNDKKFTEEKLEKERLEKERLEKVRLEKERLEKVISEKERLDKERLEKERSEKER